MPQNILYPEDGLSFKSGKIPVFGQSISVHRAVASPTTMLLKASIGGTVLIRNSVKNGGIQKRVNGYVSILKIDDYIKYDEESILDIDFQAVYPTNIYESTRQIKINQTIGIDKPSFTDASYEWVDLIKNDALPDEISVIIKCKQKLASSHWPVVELIECASSKICNAVMATHRDGIIKASIKFPGLNQGYFLRLKVFDIGVGMRSAISDLYCEG